MKKNLYFRTTVRRDNLLSNFIMDAALKCASYPRVLLEVFIRRNFGVRYFSLATVLFVAVLLALMPVLGHKLPSFGHQDYDGGRDSSGDFWLHHGSWYLFLVAFLYTSFKRWMEIQYKPGVYDFARVTTYSGDIHPRFFTLHPLGQKPSVRAVEIFYEPAVFFVAGLVLWFFGQKLGVLFMVSSIFYGLSYAGAYKKGDDFVMDKIDEMILNEEYEDAFVNGNYNNARGARYYISRPNDAYLRQRLKDAIIVDGSDTAIAE
ncbi:MAG: hypothetical protein ABUM51_10280 [Bacteroidota bacterium]